MKGRFAPSPTGHMHVGNLWVAFLSYWSARHQDGEYIVRIEDVDTQRSKPIYADHILEDLSWLGFTDRKSVALLIKVKPIMCTMDIV